jgi:CubicO group peptidase (beta-lactamase class C family)
MKAKAVLAALLTGCAFTGLPLRQGRAGQVREFEAEIDDLRREYQIPGMSVAVVQDQRIVLARGYGYADLEDGIPATEDTPYNIASCTKPLAATVLMRLVEDGQLDLDTPMAEALRDAPFAFRRHGEPVRGYASACQAVAEVGRMKDFPLAFLFQDYRCEGKQITVRHHLTHTSQGVPGQAYRYNGFLYGWLSLVAEAASGEPFADLVVQIITDPLEMTRTLPNPDETQRERVLAERARYYRAAQGGGYELSAWPSREFIEMIKQIDPDADESEGQKLDAAAGIVSTVRDLARFDVAMDRDQIVSAASKQAMYTATVSNDGRTLPYGMGWFVQEHRGTRLVWHYGHAPYAYSSLYLKVPEKGGTLILLANSDGASAPFDLGAGDVLRSPFAVAFLQRFAGMEGRDG